MKSCLLAVPSGKDLRPIGAEGRIVRGIQVCPQAMQQVGMRVLVLPRPNDHLRCLSSERFVALILLSRKAIPREDDAMVTLSSISRRHDFEGGHYGWGF